MRLRCRATALGQAWAVLRWLCGGAGVRCCGGCAALGRARARAAVLRRCCWCEVARCCGGTWCCGVAAAGVWWCGGSPCEWWCAFCAMVRVKNEIYGYHRVAPAPAPASESASASNRLPTHYKCNGLHPRQHLHPQVPSQHGERITRNATQYRRVLIFLSTKRLKIWCKIMALQLLCCNYCAETMALITRRQ